MIALIASNTPGNLAGHLFKGFRASLTKVSGTNAFLLNHVFYGLGHVLADLGEAVGVKLINTSFDQTFLQIAARFLTMGAFLSACETSFT